MAIVDRPLKNGVVVFYVTHRINGRQVWEHAGTNKRKAERRDAEMAREIKDGNYAGPSLTGQVSVGTFAETHFAARTNRTAKGERSWWTNHVVKRCPWFVALPIADVKLSDTTRLLAELRKPCTRTRFKTVVVKPIAEKSIYNIFQVVGGVFKAARMAELMERNPCELAAKARPSKKGRKRKPYSEAEVVALTTDRRIDPDVRMWNALAFYSGMRKGEVCGRRWRDWDRGPVPLGALTLDTQYGGAMLKGDVHAIGEQPRVIPVHPDLATMLDAWWRQGFEFVYCRKPTQNDFIVPRRETMVNHTGASAYYRFQRACKLVGVEAHTLHAMRNTFISLSHRSGARKDVLERVTHNAGGATIDAYITDDWAAPCEAVSCFMKDRPRLTPAPALRLVAGDPREHVTAPESEMSPDAPVNRQPAASRKLRHRADVTVD